MSTNRIGDVAELAVAADLTRKGFRVAFPFGDWHCDIIATKDEKVFYRFQVKSASYKDGSVVIHTHHPVSRDGSRRAYTSDECDWIVGYWPEGQTCYYVPVDKNLPKTGVKLRIAEAKNNQSEGIRWAEDYTNLGM